MILVWGITDDTTTASVLKHLQSLGAEVLFLDQHSVFDSDLLTTDLELDLSDDVRATFTQRGRCTDLSRVRAAYLRPYDARAFPVPAKAGSESEKWTRALALEDLLWTWADIAPANVVNRPRDMMNNSSKPLQSRQIQQAGFAVPAILVTTDADAAAAFWECHDSVIYKSISSVRSIVTKLKLDDQARWHDIATCPVQFQQFIPGTDFRVHVVGDDLFAARIDSEADDYRYAYRSAGSTDVAPADLPDDVVDRCRMLAKSQGLRLSGIDLRRTPEGEWFCFEVNPSPAFSYFDFEGAPIAAAVARLLLQGP
jgi:hypothetical protein